MSDGDANDYDKLKKALLTRYNMNFTKDGYRKRFKEVKPETEKTPDEFVRLKNYLINWLQLSGSSSGGSIQTTQHKGSHQYTIPSHL